MPKTDRAETVLRRYYEKEITGTWHGGDFDRVYRLKPGSTLMIWAIDKSPADIRFNPEYIADVFRGEFQLTEARAGRRRFVASHWYWLTRR